MARLQGATLARSVLLSAIAVALCAISAPAQSETEKCAPAAVIPLHGTQPPAKIVIDPPVAEPLARGVAIIPYCALNLHIAPVFGPDAVAVSPRVGHIHVAVDGATWVWADASGNPIILQGLSPGSHRVLITLVDANHHALDKGIISFVVPKTAAPAMDH